MKKTTGLGGLLLLLILFFAQAASADTRYVSDELIVTVRASEQPGAEVLTTVRSNDPVQVLEEGERYMKIRTQDGTVGYIQAQYITRDTPSPLVIERLQKERDRLKNRIEELEAARSPGAEELDQLKSKNARLEETLSATRADLEAARKKYENLREGSQQTAELMEERDRLQQQTDDLNAKLKRIEEENNQLLRSGMIRWFLAGGGVFLIGWIIGKVSRKKRRF